MLLDIVLDQRFSVEIVDGNIEESLVLRVMEIHGDDVVGASAGQEVCNKGTSQGYPLLVPRFGLEGSIVCGLLVVVSGEARLRGKRALMVVTSARVGAEARGSVGSPRREVFVGHDSFAELLG